MVINKGKQTIDNQSSIISSSLYFYFINFAAKLTEYTTEISMKSLKIVQSKILLKKLCIFN